LSRKDAERRTVSRIAAPEGKASDENGGDAAEMESTAESS
jgi:hypothetical protein